MNGERAYMVVKDPELHLSAKPAVGCNSCNEIIFTCNNSAVVINHIFYGHTSSFNSKCELWQSCNEILEQAATLSEPKTKNVSLQLSLRSVGN